ncbi:hypothetical protein BSNT_07592 [Bacillus subtilis subsp. natto BEST195]|nr:hypothetical protein BSNT_07592 [Bacillus subtilis subsp. natto BEST195]
MKNQKHIDKQKIQRTGVDHLFQKVYFIWKGEMTIV